MCSRDEVDIQFLAHVVYDVYTERVGKATVVWLPSFYRTVGVRPEKI